MAYPTIDQLLCDHQELLLRVDEINPLLYESTRNYLDGAVTWLSPFLTHGIIDTTFIARRLLAQYSAAQCGSLLFELAWREYFHRVWRQHGDGIFSDMRVAPEVANSEPLNKLAPTALLDGKTGIDVIDDCLQHLFTDGLMHNHARMWTASLACNVGTTHWLEPAKWLHYHLLDGDLASNSLSWQWVAGTFSNKRYIANQENINKFSRSVQHGSFLDCTYAELASLSTPEHFQARHAVEYDFTIPAGTLTIEGNTVAIRSLWNLDPGWQPDADQQIVFVDTDHYRQWPMSPNRWRFIQHWANSIPKLNIMCGSRDELVTACEGKTVYCREYPACTDWAAQYEERDWLYRLPKKRFNSFFAYWKQVKSDVGLSS